MKTGFSLVELSIVLVILGLLTGGILTGQNLIRAAEVRSAVTEFQQYQTAIMSFRDKYFALPGDMTKATDFWGAASACDHQDTSTDSSTCNGDGNGEISYGKEGFTFWQHLANAGLITGSYTGGSGPDQVAWDAVSGWNAPASKLGNAIWTAMSYYNDNGGGGRPAIGGDISSGTFDYGINQLILGADASNGWFALDPILSPEELWNIDKKVDDSKPGTGNVIAIGYSACTDAADQFEAASATANYDLTERGTVCAIIFMPRANGM